MSFLNKILKNIKRKSSTRQVFNLKYAFPGSAQPIEPVQTIQQPVQPNLDPADLFLSQQRQKAPIEYESMKREEMINYIRANMGKEIVDPIDPEILNNIQEREFFKDLASQFVDPSQLYTFLQKVDSSLAQVEEDTAVQSPSPADKKIQNLDLAYIFKLNTRPVEDIYQKLVRIVRKWGIINVDDAEDMTQEYIGYALGPPVSGGKDQRLNFFAKNQELIPEGIINKGEPNELLQMFSQDEGTKILLLNELYDLIQTVHPKVDEWVGSIVSFRARGGQPEKDKAVSTNIQQDEVGSDFGSTFEEGGKEKTFTGKRSGDDDSLRKGEAEKIIGIFVEEYVKKINVNDLQNLIKGVVLELKKPIPEDKKRERKYKNKANRLEIYFDGIFQQIRDLLTEKGKTEEENEERKIRFMNAKGGLKVGDKVMLPIFDYVKKKVLQNVTEEELVNRPADDLLGRFSPEEWHTYIKEYLNEIKIDWQPDWWKLLNYSGLTDRFQFVGELKQKILKLKKAGYQDAKAIINYMGSELDFYSTDADKKISFINETLGKTDDGTRGTAALQKEIKDFARKNPSANSEIIIKKFRKKLIEYNKNFSEPDSESDMKDFIILSMNLTEEEINDRNKEEKKEMEEDEERATKWEKAGNPRLREGKLRGQLQKKIIEFKEGPSIERFKEIRLEKENLSLSDTEAVAMKFKILLNNLFSEDPSKILPFVKKTMKMSREDFPKIEEEVAKVVKKFTGKSREGEEGKEGREGTVIPKEAFRTDVKNFLKYLYNEKQKREISPDAIEIFLDIMNPHDGIVNYGYEGIHGTGIKDEFGKEMNYTELYYNVIGEKIPLHLQKKMDFWREEKRLKRTGDKSKKTKRDIEYYDEIIDKISEYVKAKDSLKGVDKKIDKYKEQVNKYEERMNKYKERINNRLEIYRRNTSNPLIKHEDAFGFYSKTQKNKDKQDREKYDKVQKKLEKSQKDYDDEKELKNTIDRNIKIFNEYLPTLSILANSKNFKFLKESFLNTKKYIFKLSEIKRKCLNIKLASSQITSIDDQMDRAMKSFEQLFFDMANQS